MNKCKKKKQKIKRSKNCTLASREILQALKRTNTAPDMGLSFFLKKKEQNLYLGVERDFEGTEKHEHRPQYGSQG